jgi:hypothetical protein
MEYEFDGEWDSGPDYSSAMKAPQNTEYCNIRQQVGQESDVGIS